jgi:O-succinylbenzoic acid--CoA ligase
MILHLSLYQSPAQALAYLTQLKADTDFQSKAIAFLKEFYSGKKHFVLQTSGTTGEPREIVVSRDKLIASARATAAFLHLAKGQTALLCLPIDFVAGKMMLVRAAVIGLDLLLINPAIHALEKLNEPIGFAALIPAQLAFGVKSNKLNLIKKIIIGGLSVDKKLEFELAAFDAEMYETFGMTESLSHFAMRKITPVREDVFTCLPNVKIATDSSNQLIVHCPWAIENELHTKDIVNITAENTFKWIARADNVINSGGVKLYPEEIERKIANVMDMAFFISSVKDEQFGQRIMLVLESEKPQEINDTELLYKLSKVLTKREMPIKICYVAQFVKTQSNKINRAQTLLLL